MSDASRIEEDGVETREVLPEEDSVEFVLDGAETAAAETAEAEDAEIPEPLRGLSKAELARKLAEAEAKAATPDVAGAFEKGLAALGEKLAPRQAEAEAEGPPSFELSEEDRKKLKDELYTSDDPASLITNIVNKTVGKKTEYYATLAARRLAEQEAELLEMNPEYREWKTEVEAFIAKLPASQRNQVGVRRWALGQVKIANVDKIVAKKVAEELEKAKATGAAAAESPGLRLVPPRAGTAAGTQPAGSQPGAAAGKPRVYISAAQLENEKARCEAKGMRWEVYQREILPKKYGKPQGGR